MPVYSSVCLTCETEHSYIRKIADRNDVPECCGTPTERVLDAPSVPAEYATSFISPIDGKPVHGREQYFAHMKEHNVIPYESGVGKSNSDVARDLKQGRREAVIDAMRKANALYK
jgi:hypothetical protein